MTDHDNPFDQSDVTDAERAKMLRDYLAAIEEVCLNPKLMPLDDEGKAPIIQGKCRLDSEQARSYLVDAPEAVRQIEDGARGFAIYAGNPEHGTEDLVLVDHDDMESFPLDTLPSTLEVMSGSGRGYHESFANGDGIENAKGKNGMDGEVRAKNWYCVVPGSIHPTGGVYHITEERAIRSLYKDDLPGDLKPSTGAAGGSDVDTESLDSPEELENAEFTNDRDESLKSIRERDDKLDDLLTDLDPVGYGYGGDTSVADAAAASKLHFWRFKERDIIDIIRKHRNRPKVADRPGYVADTVAKYASGEQYGDDENNDAEQAAKVIDSILSKYEVDDSEETPSDDEKGRVGKLLGVVDDDNFEKLRERVADVLDTTPGFIDRHRRLIDHKTQEGPILVEDGKTWYLSGTPLKKYELLNFELGVKSFLEVPGEPQRAELTVEPEAGEPFDKPIEAKIFKRRQRFEDELLSEQFGLTFDTQWMDDDESLDLLNKYIATRDAPERRGTHHMGLHGDEFVTPASSLTPDGWAEQPETVYLERELAIERSFDLSSTSAEYAEGDVQEIVRELPHTRAEDRIIPALAWFYAAPFSPYIRDWTKTGFNILNITGDTGSGKTTTLRYLWRCFGMKGEPFDASDTWFVLLSTFGATNSIPVWHDEYKPSDMTGRERNRFHDALKKTATGSIAQRGNADKSTEEYKMEAPSVVSGEQQIQPPAERRRSIMVTFLNDTTDVGTETRRRFKQLVGSGRIEDGELKLPDDAPDTENHALAYYRWACDQDRADLRDRWHDARRDVYDFKESWEDAPELDDMEIQGLQTVVFGWRLYHDFAECMGVNPAELPGEDALDDALQHVAGAVGPNGSRKSHLDRFLELIERVAANGDYLERGTDYEVVYEGNPGREEIRINVARAFDKMSKYARDHDLGNEDLLDSQAYRDRFKTAYEKAGTYVESFDQYTTGCSNCAGVSTLKAEAELEFSRETFGLPAFDEEELKSGGGDDDGDGTGDADTTVSPDGVSDQPAAADGGVEFEQLKPKVERHVENEYSSGQIFSPAEISGAMGEDPERVESALKKLCDTGVVRPKAPDSDRFVRV